MLTVEWNVNVVTLVCVIFAIAGFYWVTKSDMTVLKANVVDIKEALKKQTEIIMQLAVQKERLDNQGTQMNQLRDEINLIRRGEGFIQRGPMGIDGQWPKT